MSDKKPLKRIAAIHDLSCFGRCALTVVMPALSAMGYQVIPVPTALLSSHTGGFTDMYFKDMTDAMGEISDHFDRLGLKFDAIYTGFLGSEEQIDVVLDFIKRFSDENTLIFVDPVMGDDGVLYSTYTERLRDRMKELCAVAHIITPNVTEASFLSGVEYKDTSADSESDAFAYAEELRGSLAALGKGKIIITGIPHAGDMFGTYGHSEVEFSDGYMYSVKRVRKSYPGTGDLFASVLLGCIMAGEELGDAVRFASDHICEVMNYSARFDTPVREGVAFERFLGELAERTRR
ncbi:MAG: pyridoxamine kinase [Clostridia bacterium]|nr:pyridoxamine kinase [Clostridia bacterium]